MLLIYSEIVTPRTTYIFDFIFNNSLGINYKAITDKEIFKVHQGEKINYSQHRITDELFIRSADILFEQNIKNTEILSLEKDGFVMLFPTENSDIDFDIFAAAFFMISRYEEYLTFTPDKWGRFKATESVAYKFQFLQKPMVNIWVLKLKNILQEKFPSIEFKAQNFNAIFSYDIDVAYAYKGRSLFRNLRSLTKDLLFFKFKNIYNRIQVLLGSKEDSGDVFNYLKEVIVRNKLAAIIFFLMGDYAENDKSLSYKNKVMKEVVAFVSLFSEIGIHPSFLSNEQKQKVIIEKNRLENLADKKILKSRQHFLKFTFPDTYNNLIEAGIAEDHSMGFADLPGFRAGTCTPFFFYDLKNEKKTSLKIFPVTCMDATFIQYLKTDYNKSLQHIVTLMEEVKKVNGTFITIWHNNHLAAKEWKYIHDKVIERAVI